MTAKDLRKQATRASGKRYTVQPREDGRFMVRFHGDPDVERQLLDREGKVACTFRKDDSRDVVYTARLREGAFFGGGGQRPRTLANPPAHA